MRAGTCGDVVDINVEQDCIGKDQICNAGFFPRLAQCACCGRCIAVIEMSTGLHPKIELAVMQQQSVCSRVIEYPRRSSDVSFSGTSFPPIVSIRYNKLRNSATMVFFVVIDGDVCIEGFEERGCIHGDREKSAIIDSPRNTCGVSAAKSALHDYNDVLHISVNNALYSLLW